MERIFSNRFFHPAAVVALAVAVLIAYSNTLYSAFQFDDLPQIVKYRPIRDLSNLPEILKGARGITIATFALNYSAGGLDTFGYHAVNIAIHAVNASLAYFFVSRLLTGAGFERARALRTAFFSALVFALHPVQTQAVTYIVQRMESLASMFYLIGMLLFMRASYGEKGFTAKSLMLYFLVAFSFLLGFYSKEMAITMPVMVFLYDLYFPSGFGLRPALKRAPLYAVMLLMLVFFALSTIIPLGGFNDLSGESAGDGPAVHGKELPTAQGIKLAPASPEDIEKAPQLPTAGFGMEAMRPKEYLLTQFNVIVYYFVLMAYPANQNLDYDFPVAHSLFKAPEANPGTVLNIPPLPPVISLAIILAVVVVAFVLFVRALKGRGGPQERAVSFFILWFFVLISPTSSFIPIQDVIYEHRIYLASLGPFAIFVILLESGLVRLFVRDRRATVEASPK